MPIDETTIFASRTCKRVPLVIDIGGEGRHAHAWNLNPSAQRTWGPERGAPIPRHLAGRADAIPLPDGCVDIVIVERTPLRQAALREIARVVASNGVVILRHALRPGSDCHRLARQHLPGLIWQRVEPLGAGQLQESIFCVALVAT